MNPSDVLDPLVLFASLALLPYFLYILLTSLAAMIREWRPDKRQGRPAPTRRFLVVIPAHDEQEGVAETVRSCLAVDYPITLFDVVVIADNCTDATADRAREAGARVVERSDHRRSKGHALEYLIAHIQETGEFDSVDAIVIIDADSTADPGLLAAFARRLEDGWEWVQSYDAVGNPGRSWRTRLLAYAFSLINGVTLVGQMALGCGAALRGNGMCLSTSGLRRVPWRGASAPGGGPRILVVGPDRRGSDRLRASRRRPRPPCPPLTSPPGTASRRRWETGRRQLRSRMLRPLLGSPHLGLLKKAALAIELTMPTASTLCSVYLLLSVLLAVRAPSLLAEQRLALLAVLAVSHVVATAATDPVRQPLPPGLPALEPCRLPALLPRLRRLEAHHRPQDPSPDLGPHRENPSAPRDSREASATCLQAGKRALGCQKDGSDVLIAHFFPKSGPVFRKGAWRTKFIPIINGKGSLQSGRVGF